jgi:DNA repair protein RecO (recombination protein O)
MMNEFIIHRSSFIIPMKPHRTEAIVLHTIAARERDKLVVFLTPEHGKRKGWAYGARGIRSRFGASLEPLTKVRIGFLEKETEEVVRIESVDLIRSLFPAQQNLVSSVAATYIADTVDTFAQADDPSELIYRLLDRTSEALLAGAPPVPVVTYAEVWILKLTGILPSVRNCVECGGPLGRPLHFDVRTRGFVCQWCAAKEAEIVPNDVADVLESILRLPVADFAAAAIPATILFEIRSLAGALRRHFLGHELKSFDILASVLMTV